MFKCKCGDNGCGYTYCCHDCPHRTNECDTCHMYSFEDDWEKCPYKIGENSGRISKDFKEGYIDGTGQACSNIESVLFEYLDNKKAITKELIAEICDKCREID